SEWRPGRADFRENPSRARLVAACHALATLHSLWSRDAGATHGPCPAIGRRFDALDSWQCLQQSGWDPLLLMPERDPLRPLVQRAAFVLARWLFHVPHWLQAWSRHTWPLQPCLCDVWHDHLLFEGDRLTGLVDYGAVKLDHVAVDLARLLGSLLDDDESSWR